MPQMQDHLPCFGPWSRWTSPSTSSRLVTLVDQWKCAPSPPDLRRHPGFGPLASPVQEPTLKNCVRVLHTVCDSGYTPSMRLTRSGANDLPARHTTWRTYGQHDKAAFAGRSWTRGRGRLKPRGSVLGAASHSSDLLARPDPARRGPRGSQDAGVEHHPVHCPGPAARRRRHSVAQLPEGTIVGRLRHPQSSSGTFRGVTVVMGPRRPGALNVPMTCEDDVPHGVTLQPGFPRRTRRDRDERRSLVVRPKGDTGGKCLRGTLQRASEGDVRGDIVRASSPSGPTVLRQSRAYSGTHRPSRPVKGEGEER